MSAALVERVLDTHVVAVTGFQITMHSRLMTSK